MNKLEYIKKWRLHNPNKVREAQRRWREKHLEKARMNHRLWKDKNPEKAKEAIKRWRVNNREKVRIAHNTWYAENKQRINDERKKRYAQNQVQRRLSRLQKRQDRKRFLVLMLGGKCVDCGYSKHLSALEFDHLDGNHKEINISSSLSSRNWENIIKEVKKCELVCANCHRIRTDRRHWGENYFFQLDSSRLNSGAQDSNSA